MSQVIPILKWVGSIAAKAVWKNIQKRLAGEPADRIDEVLKGQDKIVVAIENLSIKVEIVTAMKHILYWTKRLGEIMDEMKKLGKIDVDNENYKKLLLALGSESEGVRYQTYCIYTAIMGTPNNPLGGDALSTWHRQAYAKLSDQSNFDYHLSDYVKELDDHITPVAFLLRQGLILSLFTASTESDADSLQAECKDRCQQIVDTLYNTHYPPGLRFLKPSFEDPGEQPGKQWLWFKQQGKDGFYLVMHNFYVPSLNCFNRVLNRDNPDVWAFAIKQNAHALGPMQLISAWDFRGNQRMRLHYGWKQYTFSTEAGGGTSAILFKLIPLEVSGGSSEPAMRLVPYYEDGKTRAKDDKDTFSLVYVPVKTTL